jgi:hypothetical protein
VTTPERLKPVELYAWIGEDELGSSVIGIKQGLVAIAQAKIDPSDIVEAMGLQAAEYGKKIYLCRFTLNEVVWATHEGKSL